MGNPLVGIGVLAGIIIPLMAVLTHPLGFGPMADTGTVVSGAFPGIAFLAFGVTIRLTGN